MTSYQSLTDNSDLIAKYIVSNFQIICEKYSQIFFGNEKMFSNLKRDKFEVSKKDFIKYFLRQWGLSNFHPSPSYSYISIAPYQTLRKEKKEIKFEKDVNFCEPWKLRRKFVPLICATYRDVLWIFTQEKVIWEIVFGWQTLPLFWLKARRKQRQSTLLDQFQWKNVVSRWLLFFYGKLNNNRAFCCLSPVVLSHPALLVCKPEKITHTHSFFSPYRRYQQI